MAYDVSREKQTVVALIDKNDAGDKYQISKIEVQGRASAMVDIRLMYTPEGEDELKPTRKGIRFSAELLPQVIEALGKIEK